MLEATPARALGDFIRAHRERLSPMAFRPARADVHRA